MDTWRETAPVLLHMSEEQAARLQQGWYYRHAQFAHLPAGGVAMTFGGEDPAFILSLVRWLGPGVEILAPEEWRDMLCEELRQMLEQHGAES